MTTATLEREPQQADTTAIVIGKIDYGVKKAELTDMVKRDLALAINGIDDKAGFQLADTRRKEYVTLRNKIEKRKTALNAEARAHMTKVGEAAAELQAIIGPAEDHVTKLVDNFEAAIRKIEQDKHDAIFNARDQQLRHAGVILERIVVESLTDEQIDAKIADAIELARLRKEEADRQAAAEAERQRLAAEEKERNRIEAEKLAAERIAFERVQAEQQAEAHRLAKIEAERLAKERAEFDRIKAEQQAETDRLRKIEDDRIAEERRKLDEEKAVLAKAQREQAEREAEAKRKADEEKARVARFEAEQQAAAERKKMAAEFAEQARIQAEQKAKRDEAARVRAEQLRPSREKLLAIAEQIAAVPMPLIGAECHEALRGIKLVIGGAVQKIRDIVAEKVQ